MFPTAEEARNLSGKISKEEFYSKYMKEPIQLDLTGLDRITYITLKRIIEKISETISTAIILGEQETRVEIMNWFLYGDKIRHLFTSLGYRLYYVTDVHIINSVKKDFLYIKL